MSHRIINDGKTSRVIYSNHQPIPTMPTDHVPQCHISTIHYDLDNMLTKR